MFSRDAENQKPMDFHFPTILKSKKQKRLRFRSQVNTPYFFKIEKRLWRLRRRQILREMFLGLTAYF
jgi:hypothetical protein